MGMLASCGPECKGMEGRKPGQGKELVPKSRSVCSCTSQIDGFCSKEELTHLKLEGGPQKSGKSSGLFKGTWLRKVWHGGDGFLVCFL